VGPLIIIGLLEDSLFDIPVLLMPRSECSKKWCYRQYAVCCVCEDGKNVCKH